MSFFSHRFTQIGTDFVFNSSVDYTDYADYFLNQNRRNLRNLRINSQKICENLCQSVAEMLFVLSYV